jgi:KUP system potassium uptake protein
VKLTKAKKSIALLALGALGIVFGDIGTSPLYAFSVMFGPGNYHIPITEANILGIISLVIWSITLVVSIKFVGFIMRADNEGEGGIMALIAKVKGSTLNPHYKWGFLILGLLGVSLFYGDIMITPAISVLSAVEGLKVITPSLDSLIIPATLVILASLFAIQRYGTGFIGKLFGPVMLLWFVTIAIGGGWQTYLHPEILMSLSPLTAIHFFAVQPLVAFIAMGVVILAITGAEALYADMGHFGRPSIARAWFFVVFPALILCYMGEGALLLHTPGATANPLVLLYPEVLRIPIVILATLATIIASQAVISGAFSLTRQLIQLDFLPRMLIRHTSTERGGQIYLPFVNVALLVAVALLVILFGSSAKLANAYGIAVSGTLATDTILYLVLLRSVWKKSLRYIVLTAAAFLPVDLLFVASSTPKIAKGGWFPVIIAACIFVLIMTWLKGEGIVVKERRSLEGSLGSFIKRIHALNPPIARIPGTAIYINHHANHAPLALHATLDDLHELHEKVVIVSVYVATVSHISEGDRAVYNPLGHYSDGISHVSLTFGFHDVIDIPEAMKYIRNLGPELDFNLEDASYFISLSKVIRSKRHNLSAWQKTLYLLMERNSLSTSDFYKLPIEHTVEMRSFIKL